MKINFGAALTGLASLRLGLDRLAHPGDLRFEGTRDHARALQAAFKGRIRQPAVMSTSDGPQVLRAGKSGLFNLQSFRRIFRPPDPSGGDAPRAAAGHRPIDGRDTRDAQDAQDAQGVSRALGDRATSSSAGAAQAVRPVAVGLLDTIEARAEQLKADVDHWRHCEQAMHRAPTSAAGVKQAVLARSALERRIAEGLKELHELGGSLLDAEARRSGVGQQAHAEISKARLAHAAAATALALPELWRPPASAVPGETDPGMQDLQRSLLALHDRAVAAGGAPPALDRVVAAFANQQRIREFAGSPVTAQRADAVSALTHMLDTVVAAVGPGRDGSSLNALIGISGELDALLKTLRVDATRSFMLQRAAQARDILPGSDEEAVAIASADSDARTIVDLEFDIAATKRTIQRALAQDGAGVGGWAGVKVDASLVDGLRNTLGASAQETGLIVASLVAGERALVASPAAQRLLQDVQGELHEARNTLASVADADDRAALGGHVRYLEARERSLQTEEDVLVGRLAEANESLLALHEKIRGSSQAEPELHERIAMAQGAQDHWKARWQAISLPPELRRAREQVAALDRTIADLDDRLRAQDLAETVERNRGLSSAATAGTRGEDLRLERAEAQARRDEAMHALLGAQAEHAAASGSNAHWGGLTQEELTAVGLQAADAREALEISRTLARRGLSSAEQAGAMVSQANSVMSTLRARRFGVEALAERATGLSNAATNTERAKALGGALQRRLMGDSLSMEARLAPLAGVLGPITKADINTAVGDLRAHARRHATLEQELFDLSGGLENLQRQKDGARDALRRFNAEGTGRSIDLDRPAGARSSLRMREAIDLHRATGGLARASEAQLQRFQALCAQLRGYDADTLTTPRRGGAPLTAEDVGRLAGRPGFEAAIDAVVLLREQAPATQSRIEAEIAHTTGAMDATILERGRLMGAEAYGALRDATRVAVLAQLEAEGGDVVHFQPSMHAAAIKERLGSWGVPVQDARPEIDSFLAQSFGPDELNLWVRQAAFSASERSRMRDDLSRHAAESSKAPLPRGLQPSTRKALLDGVGRLTVGSKVSLSAGDRIELQTGAIAVEPTGVLGVNVKVAVGHVAGLEIARYADGYELVMRRGWDGKAGAEVSAKVWQAKAIGLRADASATIEAAGMRMGGVALRFPNTPAGRAAMEKVLDGLASSGEMTARDFCAAQSAMAVVEHKIGVKVGAGAKVGFDYGTSSMPKGAGSDVASVAIGARAAVAAGIAQTRSVTENSGLVIHKGEREVSVEASVAAGASLRLGIATGAGKAAHNTSSEVLEATAGAAFVYKIRSREVRGADGLVQPGAQQVVQAYLPPAGKEGALGALGGAEFAALMDRLQRSDRPEDRGLVGDLKMLVDRAGPNDTVSIVTSLDERVRPIVNDRLAQARALRSDPGDTGDAAAKATELEDQAQALLDDRGHYIVSRLWLVPTSDTIATLAPVNLMFARWNATTQWGDAQVRAEIKFDETLAREVHDAVGAANHPIR